MASDNEQTDSSPEPTPEEVAAAQAVMNRKFAADRARADTIMPAMRELTNDPAYDTILTAAVDLRTKVQGISPFSEFLTAIVTGMASLKQNVV